MIRRKDQEKKESLKKQLAEKSRELSIEAALEKVRTVALNMREPSDMLKICTTISKQLQRLGVKEIRNVQTAIFYVNRGTYMNYEFYAKHDKTFITETTYGNNKIHRAFARKMLKGKGEFFVSHIRGDKVKEWIKYQESTNVFIDRYLKTASSLNYYWHSLGPVALGISTYSPLSKEELDLFHRFIRVFDLAYRRYLDIEKAEKQAREAQMEVAVERVRAKALAMHRSDEIHEVVRTLRHELFGLNLEGIMGATICLEQPDGQVRLWDITDIKTTGRYGWDILFDITKIDPQLWVKKIWDSRKKITATEQDSKDLRRALKWLSRYDKKTAEEISKLLKVNGINHGWHRAVKLANGVLITDFTKEPPVETETILLKIGAAFDLAYKRFLDLQKAEAQAREAQIEAALERVRSSSMAMHQSGDLHEVIKVVTEQLCGLRLKFDVANFAKVDETGNWDLWLSTPAQAYPAQLFVPYLDHPIFNRVLDMRKTQLDHISDVYDQKDKNVFFRHFFKNSEAKHSPESRKKQVLSRNGFARTLFYFKNIWFAISNYDGIPFSDQDIEIFRRFAKAFEQSYIRFLDLQRAEAQAREAQIEAALEKVRSRSMAMHRSDELKDVIRLVLQQFGQLNINAEHAGFYIDYKAHEDMHIWLADPNLEPFYAVIPYFDTPTWNSFLEAKANGTILHTDLLDFKTKNKFYHSLFKLFTIPEEARKFYLKCKGLAVSTVLLDNVGLYIENFSAIPYTDEENNLLIRFGNVFQQTYTRFLDLQKAEAQAREAQIEAALERVRSRTMAMHTSSELIQTAELLFDQLKLLGAELQGVAFAICDKDSVMVQKWTSIGVFSHPYTIEPGEERMYEAWKNQAGMHEEVYEGERQKKYYEAFMQIPAFKQGIQKFIDSGHPLPAWQKNHAVPFKFGYLLFITTKPFNETQIFLRFGKVFEQTYTRFLDLQKAEAQAREAQIEAALERVRARAMAMHSSQELNEVVHELRKQMGLLGQKDLETCVIHLNEESSDFIHSWAAIRPPDREGEILVDSTARVPKKGLRIIEEAMEAYSSNRQDYILLNEGDKLRQWFSFLKKESPRSYSRLVESVQGRIEDLRAFWSFADFSGGSLLMVTMEQPDDLARGLLRRFANVFGLAYRRFADLKQAEAQAKEAEIQLALERVRARSLAMHHTSELQEVVNVTAQQLLGIGMDINGGVFICINAEVDSGLSIWASGGMADYIEKIVVPFLNKPIFTRIRDAIKKGNAFLIESFTDQEKRELFTHLFQFEPWQSLPQERKEALLSRTGGFARSVVISRHTSISITNHHGKAFSEQENEILKRFGKVFEQSYTRFLDLQKAEAQAREAEIELGLERVRARAMAMQSSEELSTLIGTVFTELTKLDLALTRCIIWVFEPATHAARWWMANSEEPSHPMSFYIKYHEHPAYLTFVREWKNKNVKFIYDLKGQDKLNWDDILFNETELSNLSEVVKNGMKAPERVLLSASFNNFGGINAASLEPLSNEHFDILLRFAKVFDLTYTRFLDLKNAEAQAREAQIEAALERVRSQAMGMRQSGDLLDIVVTMRTEFTRLGHEAHYFWYMRWLPDKYEKAMTSGDGSRIGMIMSLPRHIHGDIPLVSHWEKSEEPALVYAMDVDAAINYVDKMVALGDFELVDPHAPTHDDIRHIQGLTFVMARTMHGEIGYSLPGVVLNPPEEDIKTLVRFANVFDLAYRRFEDLKEAENRNRETQIELALERTRTKTMLMQHSDELLEISEVFHQQLLLLGIDSEFSFVWLPNEEKGDHLFWATWMEEKDGAAVFHTRAITYPLDLTEPYTAKCFEDWRSGVPVHEHFIAPENIGTFFASWEELLEGAEGLKPVFFSDGIYYTEAFMKYGCFGIDIRRPLSQQEQSVLHRFAIEFERTYTRFLDLQKAEAQAREATIEAALEKVRSRSLAMHKSEELKEVVIVVFEKLKELGLTFDVAGIQLYTAGTRDLVQWVAAPGLVAAPVLANLPFVEEDFKDSEIIQDIWAAKDQGKNIYSKHYSFVEKNKFFAYAGRNNDLNRIPAAAREVQMKAPGYTQSLVAEKNSALWVDSYTGQTISVEEFNVLGRFARVFEQAYVRFLDLQKAEVQAREAQIEAALERVRSRSMGMQRGEDLKGVVKELYEQLKSLGFNMGVAAIQIIDAETGDMDVWMEGSEDGYELPERFHVPYFDHPAHNRHLKQWKSGDPYAVLEISGPDKKNYDHYFFFHTEFVKAPEQTKIFMMSQESLITSMAYMKYGAVGWAPSPLNKEQALVLQRFAKVFEQTYTRFLDLQRAEAQVREAQIEAALEKVRSRSLAMHHSDELREIIGMVYIMLSDLKVKHDTIAIQVFDFETRSAVFWPRNTLQKEAPKVVFPYDEKIMKEDTPHRDLWEAMATGEPILNKVYTKKQKNLWLEYVFIHNDYTVVEEQSRQYLLQLEYLKICFFPERYSGLYAESWDGKNYSAEDIDVLKRAARVFEQAYVRFLDLQKAEAQAREATIEASLERVRSKAMAMHNSQDLAATIQTFYRELNSLNLTPRRCGVGLIDRETRMTEVSTMNTTPEGASMEILGKLILQNHPVLEGVYEHWLAQEEYHPVLRGNEISEYYQLMRPQIQFPDYPLDAVQYGHFFFFDEGGVYAWTEMPLAEDELKIYRRFTSVLSLTYKRYRDLRNAEARAKEAVRQASLDRLRAEIASMRTAADLDRITPLIWKELTTLGIPFVRCGVFIMDEPNNQIHTYLSTPDGRAIAAFHLPLDNPGNLGEAVQHWREHKAYVTRWVDKDFQAQADLLAHLGAVDSRDQYLSNVPADGIYLHLSPFRQGMLYVGNTGPLSDAELDLVQSLSDAFSVAYARYDDFRQLEMAKKDVENALAGLKQAQQQLVQSEKMASLGELTAGIAHEIQNPLNFVNNFAEVNKELLDEIEEERRKEKGERDEHVESEILNAIRQNLEKINFHGKRADGIVKSMLQHSRSGDTGGKNKKELTDLNKLAEEYLRLAYHGLRAKDKYFNAALHTDFDETVGLIEVSGQDLARAILNLINNAFYAIQDKEKVMKSRGEAYTPQVSLITKRIGQTVEIRVKDNGPGIPKEVMEKIFQPFFTTKPTGQGTGLGLSLSYDIVKAHGGELKVETLDGEGSTFIISIPNN